MIRSFPDGFGEPIFLDCRREHYFFERKKNKTPTFITNFPLTSENRRATDTTSAQLDIRESVLYCARTKISRAAESSALGYYNDERT